MWTMCRSCNIAIIKVLCTSDLNETFDDTKIIMLLKLSRIQCTLYNNFNFQYSQEYTVSFFPFLMGTYSIGTYSTHFLKCVLPTTCLILNTDVYFLIFIELIGKTFVKDRIRSIYLFYECLYYINWPFFITSINVR